MAVVNDGQRAVIVVRANTLVGWRARLAGSGVPAAPSCIDAELLAIVRRVIASAKPQPGAILSVGYDGLHDLIAVRGMPDDAFLRAIEGQAPGFRERALGAIAAGTLQLTP